MANIKVTPEELDAQGKDLIQYAEDLRDVLSSINDKIQEIEGGWDGLAEQAYLNMYETMKESLDQFPELVQGLGDATVAAADAFSQLDTNLQGEFNRAAQ